MKHKHDTGANRGLGGRIAAALVGAVCALCVSATPALAVEASITNTRVNVTYEDLAIATAMPQTGDQTNLAIPVAIAVIGIVVVAGAVIIRRRNK